MQPKTTQPLQQQNQMFESVQSGQQTPSSEENMVIQKLPPKDGYKTERNRGNTESLAK